MKFVPNLGRASSLLQIAARRALYFRRNNKALPAIKTVWQWNYSPAPSSEALERGANIDEIPKSVYETLNNFRVRTIIVNRLKAGPKISVFWASTNTLKLFLLKYQSNRTIFFLWSLFDPLVPSVLNIGRLIKILISI